MLSYLENTYKRKKTEDEILTSEDPDEEYDYFIKSFSVVPSVARLRFYL